MLKRAAGIAGIAAGSGAGTLLGLGLADKSTRGPLLNKGKRAAKFLLRRKLGDQDFTEADFAALDKIVKNVRENSKNSDREFADETKKGITLQ